MRTLFILPATVCIALVSPRVGHTETACGSVSAGWNAPNGAFVTTRGSTGPISPVVSALGEYRTHSMTSHGTTGWVTHETMREPEMRGWPDLCSSGPANHDQLRYGYPGAEQVNQGAIYTSQSGWEYIGYQMTETNGVATAHGADIANYFWSALPYWWQGAGFYRIGPVGGSPLNYSLYQYRDLWNVNQGWIGHNNGMVCSTLSAWAHYNTGKGIVSAKTYSHSQMTAAGSQLYNAVENGISGWDNFLGGFACFEPNGIADDAARQVRNCMAANACNTDDDSWYQNVANNPSTTATSISPDRVGGWSGNPFTGYPQSGVSAYAYDDHNNVQWNTGGNSYGCWY